MGSADGDDVAGEVERRLTAAGWHAVRILRPGEMTRSRGFPPEERDPLEMLDWCTREAPERHAVTRDAEGHRVFWFRERGDAQRFALRWFPYKCT